MCQFEIQGVFMWIQITYFTETFRVLMMTTLVPLVKCQEGRAPTCLGTSIR